MSIWHPFYDKYSDELLAHIKEMTRGTADEYLGIDFIEIGEDYIRGTVQVNERTRQPFGLLHGGISVVLAESLGSFAANLCIDPRVSMCVGLDVNANHLRAVRKGTITGKASPVHIGKGTQVWLINMRNERDQMTCIARLTMAVIPRPAKENVKDEEAELPPQ